MSRRTFFNTGAALCFALAVALEDGPTWAVIATGLITYYLMDAVDHMQDPQEMDLDELTERLHRMREEHDEAMREGFERMAASLLSLGIYLWVKRGVRRRGGPKWAAYGFGAVAMYAAQPEIRKAVAEARPEVEEAIRQLREMRKESGTS